MLMMLGRLLGLSAILLQIAVFLQPLLPEKHSVFSVCKTIAAALHLEVTNVHPHHSFATSHPHSNQASGADQNNAHVFTHVQNRHEHQERDDAAAPDRSHPASAIPYRYSIPNSD